MDDQLYKLLGTLDDGLKFRARLVDQRSHITEILGINLQTEFTNHSVTHSDNVRTGWRPTLRSR